MGEIQETRTVDRRLTGLFLAVAWGFVGWTVWKYLIDFPFLRETAAAVDFGKHYDAALALAQGTSPYIASEHCYPLFTAWLFAFLSLWTYDTAVTVWNLIHLALTLGTAFIGVACYRPHRAKSSLTLWAQNHWGTLGALACALFAPALLDFHAGNIEPLNLFLVVALGAALLRRHHVLAGTILGFLCLIKITPILFLPAFMLAKRWRIVGTWAAVMVFYALALLVTGTWRWELDYLTRLLPAMGHLHYEVSFGFAASTARWFAPQWLEDPDLYSTLTQSVSVAVAVVYGVALWMARHTVRRDKTTGYILGAFAVILVSPLVEYHHYCFAAGVWLLYLRGGIEGRYSPRLFSIGFALWLALFACRYVQATSSVVVGKVALTLSIFMFTFIWWLETIHAARSGIPGEGDETCLEK